MSSTPIWLQITLIVIGAFLAIIGGYFGVIIRVRVEKQDEINFIKVCLIDELNDVCNAYKNIEDTFKKSSVVYAPDLNKLRNYTSNYQAYRQRIYLIDNEELRKEIRTFYQTLLEAVNESFVQITNLGVNAVQPNNTHNKVLQKMENAAKLASALKSNLEKYQFKRFNL
jgi:hypothetical protein